MITLTILGIVVVMGIPAFNEARTRGQVRSATNEVASAVRWARAESLRTNQGGAVVLQSGTCPDNTPAAWSVTVGNTAVRCASLTDFSARYPLVSPLTAQRIEFNSRGILINAVPAYVVSSTTVGLSRVLNVELSGRVFENNNEAAI